MKAKMQFGDHHCTKIIAEYKAFSDYLNQRQPSRLLIYIWMALIVTSPSSSLVPVGWYKRNCMQRNGDK